MSNFYETLGISKEASETEVKKAYRSLSLKFHPDRNPSEEAKSKIQEINEAYETLGDGEKREQYNMDLQGSQNMGEFTDINQLFGMMFGQGFPGQGFPGQVHMQHGGFPMHMQQGHGPGIHVFHSNGQQGGFPGMFRAEFTTHAQPPPPIIKEVEMTLEQCFRGCSVPVEIERWSIISNMKVHENEIINVTFPAGIDENDTLQLKNGGNKINDQVKGDINIRVKIMPHKSFKRQGLDLIIHKKISLKEALCGFSFDISHINGKTFSLNNNVNPSIIKPGFKKVIPNLGMSKDNATGNMIVELDVEFPETLTEEQTKSLRELL